MDFFLVSSFFRYESHLLYKLFYLGTKLSDTIFCCVLVHQTELQQSLESLEETEDGEKSHKSITFFFLSCNGHPSCCRNCFVAACFFLFILTFVDSKRFEDADQKMRGKLMKIRRNNISIGPHHKCV